MVVGENLDMEDFVLESQGRRRVVSGLLESSVWVFWSLKQKRDFVLEEDCGPVPEDRADEPSTPFLHVVASCFRSAVTNFG